MKILITFSKAFEKIILAIMVILPIGWLFYSNLITNLEPSEFVYLSNSFLHGVTYFLKVPNSFYDVVYHQGRYYFHQGPFPAVFLMPFVLLFGTKLKTGVIFLILNLINFVLFVKIATYLKLKLKDAVWLTVACLFGSVYLLIASYARSWSFAQIITTTLVIASLYLFSRGSNWVFIGILTSFVLASRFHVGIGLIIFYILALIFPYEEKNKNNLAINLVRFLLPVIFVLSLIGLYNYMRFDNFLSTGYGINSAYSNQNNPPEFNWKQAYDYGGLVDLRFIPTNFYYYFLKSYDPVLINENAHILKPPFIRGTNFGTSILISSPIFLFCLISSWKHKIVRFAWISSGFIVLVLLTWNAITISIVPIIGQRFFIDLIPFLFLILIYVFKDGIRNTIKGLIFITFLINFYLVAIAK